MDGVMKSLETPQWMLDLFKAIDALDMSPRPDLAFSLTTSKWCSATGW